MDRAALVVCFEAMDRHLPAAATLFIYGSAAFILLGEEGRTSLDLDVAGPYCSGGELDLRRAAEAAGVPVNPDESYAGDHLEWVGPLRLCLGRPDPATDLVLWSGRRLTVKTVAAARLAASKLIRYDETDQADIRFLVHQSGVTADDVARAVADLPAAFARDPLVHENLANLRTDLALWEGSP